MNPYLELEPQRKAIAEKEQLRKHNPRQFAKHNPIYAEVRVGSFRSIEWSASLDQTTTK